MFCSYRYAFFVFHGLQGVSIFVLYDTNPRIYYMAYEKITGSPHPSFQRKNQRKLLEAQRRFSEAISSSRLANNAINYFKFFLLLSLLVSSSEGLGSSTGYVLHWTGTIQIEAWLFSIPFYRRSHSKEAKQRALHVHQRKTKHFIAKLSAQPIHS